MTNDLNSALCPAQHHAHTGRLLLVTLLWLTASAGAQACNIPVFRYALERWNADEVEIVVFMDQRLTKEQSDYIEKLQQQSVTAGGPVNCRVAPVMVRDDETDSEQTLWHSLRQAGETVKLPFVVARSRSGRGRIMNHWKASLDQTIAQGPLQDSPARTEIVNRLLRGDAVVWLVLRPDTSTASKNAADSCTERLKQQCQLLPRQLQLPDGIGLPGSELYSDVPLLLQFSVLEIDGSDRREQYLIEQLTGFRQEEWQQGEALVVPVFGRGRVLEVIPASEVSPQLVKELAEFLCGACSCQVKEQNPGFDLLLSTAWTSRLFGEDAPPVSSDGEKQQSRPQLIPIPSGRRR